MKVETTFFDEPAIISRGEQLEDSIRDIARHKEQEDAFAVLDAGNLVQKIKTWRLLMPRVKIFYAMKCNDNKTVLQILSSLGTGFDCASKAEIKTVMELGVPSSRIIFAHPCKPASHLRHAAASGVNLLTFDNETELVKVKAIMPHARLVLRIRSDATKSQCSLGDKFGAEEESVLPLLAAAKTLDLNVVGVSFHVGSGCQEPEAFFRAITAARKAFDIATEMGFSPYLLDIGGGFPGNSGTSIDEIADYVNAALEEHFPEDEIEVIAEPGRYVVASAFTVATQVVAKRRVEAPPEGGIDPSFMYYINDGVYGSFNCLFYDHQEVHPKVLNMDPDNVEEEEEDSFSCSIWGPTCDSLDQVVEQTTLPELEIGDWLVWKDMGAYTLSAAGTFNGFPVPLVHVIVPFYTWLSLEGGMADAVMPHITLPEARDPQDPQGANLATGGVAQTGPQDHLRHFVPSFVTHFGKDQDHSLVDHVQNGFNRLSVLEI